MSKNTNSIPVNTWSAVFSEGVFISRNSFDELSNTAIAHSHRDDWHLFILQEKGATIIEVDFVIYELKPLSVLYIHPNQVHRLLAFHGATIYNWAINNENLKPEYLKLLENMTPLKPLTLNADTFSIITETASLGMKYAERKYEILYTDLLKDSCNTLVALVVSQFLAQSLPTDKFSRFETITKTFKTALDHDFKTLKSPSLYASKINISTAYLNECVKKTTGHSVSYHIQQRIILEAKRMLYHSAHSIKEIASELGFDDYSYFIRLFTSITGMTPLSFRNKNHE